MEGHAKKALCLLRSMPFTVIWEPKTKGTDIGSSIAASKKRALLLLFEGGLEKQPQLCGVSLSK